MNGKPLEVFAEPGSYLTIRRTWHTGDTVVLDLPMELREEALPGDRRTVAALYGPLVLASVLGDGPTSGVSKIITGRATAPTADPANASLPVAAPSARPAEWLSPVAGDSLQFRAREANGRPLDVLPMYRIRDQRYSVYWQRHDA